MSLFAGLPAEQGRRQQAGAVPEPGTGFVLAIGALMMICGSTAHRRHQRGRLAHRSDSTYPKVAEYNEMHPTWPSNRHATEPSLRFASRSYLIGTSSGTKRKDRTFTKDEQRWTARFAATPLDFNRGASVQLRQEFPRFDGMRTEQRNGPHLRLCPPEERWKAI